MREADLRPATREEVLQSLAIALRFNGRKRYHQADDYMADMTAEHLAKHLEASGYVVMKRRPLQGHGSMSGLRRAPGD
ncbi:hypothetical protein SAMN05519103_09482 [Rhizobiales bacterium GAS113]|nr:hypothetical protein SAMN05519103_09482 [Rhizobiales bacterium GAS113]